MDPERMDPERMDHDLDQLFATARDTAPELPDSLAARMVEDALAVQAEALTSPAVERPVLRIGIFRQFLALLGGWPAMAGLATATVAGIWIGMSPPTILTEGASALGWQSVSGEDAYLVDTMSIFDTLAGEG